MEVIAEHRADPTAATRSVATEIGLVLARRIVGGLMRPGERVRQDAIAAEFRASHVPVREAFRWLEGQGLLVSEPRRGVRVAPLDAATIAEVAAMRAALECLGLRRAFPRLETNAISELKALADQSARGADLAGWEAANRRFHRALVEPCAMPRLLQSIDNLHQASARFLLAIWRDLDWQPRSSREHQDIVERLAADNLEGACLVLESHIIEAGDALVALLRENESS